ncbi:MAG: sulfatase-like hydrolase/transferase [Fuerstiella sp.]
MKSTSLAQLLSFFLALLCVGQGVCSPWETSGGPCDDRGADDLQANHQIDDEHRPAAVPTAKLAEAASLIGSEPSVEVRPPNIVLIMADDIAYDNNFGAYGPNESWTPRLDQMAEEGITFEHAYSTPKCTPSRVKLMTGRSGIRNYIGFGKLATSEVTFVQMLGQAGYKTHCAGKWQLDGKDGTLPQASGFDSWFLWNTAMARGSRYWGPEFNVNGKHVVYKKDVYGPDLCVQSLLEFVKQNKDVPFFAYYPMLLVHNPFDTTPDSPIRKRKDPKANFKDMVHYMDKCVGKVIDGLKEHGVEDNTVVLFCTDNGTNREMTYESFGNIVKGKKGVPHDRGTHSPLIVWAPDRVPAGARCGDLIDFSDVLPTLADVSGAALPEVKLDGRSFWPQCCGAIGSPREWIYQYYWPKSWSWIPDELGNKELTWVQNKQYKLHGNGLFYDIKKDREEKKALPKSQMTDEQRKVYTMFTKAIATMPKTNLTYQKKTNRK